MLSAETRELLQDFEKRMRFVNLVKYWLDRPKPQKIRDILRDNDDRTDNLILMVLVFIMDSTLRYGERCTKSDITGFLREVSGLYGYSSEAAETLADHIVTDVLQSGGKIREFDTYQSGDGAFRRQTSLVLIEQQNGSYVLTNEAYEFLFRTKEIDSELDFSVSRFKLQEFIRRGNYSKALRESRELVSRMRNLKTRMDDFMLRCRTNISEISVDEYEEIITQVRDSFEDESKQMSEIRTLTAAKLQAIADAAVHESESIGQTEREIREILENIDTVIREQSRVYNRKFTLSGLYSQLLDDSFSYLRAGHFDIEQEILAPMRQMHLGSVRGSGKLFKPLYKPEFRHLFGLDFFYKRQNAIRAEQADSGIDISDAESAENTAEERNSRYVAIIRSLLGYAAAHISFRFGEYADSLPPETLADLMRENLLTNVMLKLYAFGEIDIAAWREEHNSIIVPVGEFDLAYCLSEIPDELIQMQSIIIGRTDSILTFDTIDGRRITMNDLTVEVRK